MAPLHDPTTTPNLPQADTSSNTWDPSTISNLIFSAIMVCIGIIAIWQAHQVHRRSSRALDQEDLIGIQLLSRASTMLSNESCTVTLNPPTLTLSQVASTSQNEAITRELMPPRGLETLNGADVHNTQ